MNITNSFRPSLAASDQPKLQNRNHRTESPSSEPTEDRVELNSHAQQVASPKASVYEAATVLAVGAGSAVAVGKMALAAATAGSLGVGLATGGLALGGLVAGYALADGGSAIFHWAVDNYPTGETPIVGQTADEFQIHHKHPHNLEEGHLLGNMSLAGQFAALPAMALAVLNPPVAAAGAAVGFLTGITVAQGSHRWTHSKKLQPLTKALQGTLFQSRKDHNDHHAQPHAGNYAIVNGMTNPLFDKSHFFRKAEKLVYEVTGKEPHTWKDSNLKAFALGEISEAEYLDPKNKARGRADFKKAIAENYAQIEKRKKAQARASR